MRISVGTAGWSIGAATRGLFPAEGAHLQRYAARFELAEINSSFYRPHRPATYARWAASTPPGFRFAVKTPREITHLRRLVDCGEPLARFAEEIDGLGEKLAAILVQLPPSLPFEPERAAAFFTILKSCTAASLACEPRHPSWFTPEAELLLCEQRVARVAADPPLAPGAQRPGGWRGLAYFRWHGSPRVYYSAYGLEMLEALAAEISGLDAEQTLVVFDNTALGAAAHDALVLRECLASAWI